MLRAPLALAVCVALLLCGCENAYEEDVTRTGDPEWLHEAVDDLTDVVIYDILSPPQAARAHAYSSIAAYEAVVRFGIPERRFASFREGAAEAAQSRLYGGIHYPMSIGVGVQQGKAIGGRVLSRLGRGSLHSEATVRFVAEAQRGRAGGTDGRPAFSS